MKIEIKREKIYQVKEEGAEEKMSFTALSPP